MPTWVADIGITKRVFSNIHLPYTLYDMCNMWFLCYLYLIIASLKFLSPQKQVSKMFITYYICFTWLTLWLLHLQITTSVDKIKFSVIIKPKLTFFFQTQLLQMVRNTTKPLEGLKVLLFHLFTPDEVRQSSLKGWTTVTGGENVGLQKQKLDLIYCEFKIHINNQHVLILLVSWYFVS